MKDNKLIAEFMGLENPFNGITDATLYRYKSVDEKGEFQFDIELHEMRYHLSWDWLMPVVEKIERDERYDVDILQYGTRITDNQKEIVNNIADISFDKKIEHTYDAIVKFIQYYQKKNVIAGVDFSESINQLNNL